MFEVCYIKTIFAILKYLIIRVELDVNTLGTKMDSLITWYSF